MVSELKVELEMEDLLNFPETLWILEMRLSVPILFRMLNQSRLQLPDLLWAQKYKVNFNNSGYPHTILSPMDIFVWNIRGGGSKNFLRTIRVHNPSILVLVETRVNNSNADRIIRRIGYQNHYKVDTLGFSGGILFLWRGDNITVDVLSSSEQSVHAVVKRKQDCDWLISAIYASPNREKNCGICLLTSLIPMPFLGWWLGTSMRNAVPMKNLVVLLIADISMGV